jgi:hypothetical protein
VVFEPVFAGRNFAELAAQSAVIAGLPHAGWTLTEQEIREPLDAFENE